MNSILKQALALSDHYRNIEADLFKAISVLEDIKPTIRNNSLEFVLLALRLAPLYRDTGKNHLAVQLYEQALPVAKAQNSPIYLADLLRSISFIKLQETDIAYALVLGLEAEAAILPTHGKRATQVKANVYALLGNIYFAQKEFKQALIAYQKALSCAEKGDFIQREITVHGDLAHVYLELGQYEQAIAEIQTFLPKAESLYRISVPALLLRLGKIHLKRKDFIAADNSFSKALKRSSTEHWERDVAEAYEELGKSALAQHNSENAKKYLSLAAGKFDSIGLSERAKYCLSLNT